MSEKVNKVFAIRPKPQATRKVFFYEGLQDIPQLIAFVGARPAITPDLTLQFKKVTLKEKSYIEVNQYGEIISVLNEEQITNLFEVQGSAPFDPSKDTNKVIEKTKTSK